METRWRKEEDEEKTAKYKDINFLKNKFAESCV